MKLHIKGSGATSATTSLLVQNSAGGSVFSVRDDGALLFYRSSNSAELLRIDDTGTNPRLVSSNNQGKSLTLMELGDAVLSAYLKVFNLKRTMAPLIAKQCASLVFGKTNL